MNQAIQKFRGIIKDVLIHTEYFARKRNARYLEHFRKIPKREAHRIYTSLSDSWKEPNIIHQQNEYVEKSLKEYRQGLANPVFDALTHSLLNNIDSLDEKSILEVGCSSGYYSEVLKQKKIFSKFQGCDYSEAFISYARKKYPDLKWDIEDATHLSYGDNEFDIVISGGCILHIYEYEKAISEAARVAKESVVFHRTPVLKNSATTYYHKKAYDIEMIQIHFNEEELISMMKNSGLELIDTMVSDEFPYWEGEDHFEMKTFLTRKL